MREQDEPLAFVIGEASGAVGGVGAEGGSGFVDEGHGHGGLPLRLTISFQNREIYSIDRVNCTYP